MLPIGNHRSTPRQYTRIILVAIIVFLVYLLQFLYQKCDTRVHMTQLLLKTTTLLKEHHIEYWLDKGTLLGFHRDKELIPWEYDSDLGVMEEYCQDISKLKPEFLKLGLVAYDRQDHIPHKVKLTYNTEQQYFYWSDPQIHDPCIRIYDASDYSAWVDIYWYKLIPSEHVEADPNGYLLPPQYNHKDDLLCCSEGIQNFTDVMCCGGCVPYSVVKPLKTRKIALPYGTSEALDEEPFPKQSSKYLEIVYGPTWNQKQIKGWKGVVCMFWVDKVKFTMFLMLFVALGIGVYLVARKRNKSPKAKH